MSRDCSKLTVGELPLPVYPSMTRRRKTKRRAPRNAMESEQMLGRNAAIIWGGVALTWGYTGWAVYSTVVRRVHVHVYDGLLLIDVVLLALAIWMTIEWRRRRRR